MIVRLDLNKSFCYEDPKEVNPEWKVNNVEMDTMKDRCAPARISTKKDTSSLTHDSVSQVDIAE